MIKANKITERYVSYIFSDDRIRRKLIKNFEKICEDEGVELKYFENCESLNNYRGVYDKKKFAAGVYQFTRFIKTGKISDEDSKRILLSINTDKDSFTYSNCFTFAHELGHHFAIKYDNDDSEETADSYVSWLCEKNLNGFEFNRIYAYTKIYEGYDIAYNKKEYEKLKSEGKKVINANTSNFVIKEFKFRNFLLENTVKEIKRRRKLKNSKKPIKQRFFDFFNSFNKF